ncbi:helix-turn-helix transcriptional regulator [Streptomyces sp. NBC_00876]|uniref:helix-turn-helix transcriptional regulator n=1 Tax=Streptomyces sp. NBC_00876 TaxID=2975853 RepID=UPI00386945AB|nr:helix-turn-helix transcriptional regulator [Streptomyces sp. NBC_00876]
MSISDIHAPTGPTRLGPLATRAYQFAVTRKSFRAADLIDHEGFSPSEAQTAMEQLHRYRLVSRSEDGPGRFVAVPPDRARTLLLGEPVRKLNRLIREVDQTRYELSNLIPIYENSLLQRMGSQSVQLIEDLDTVRQLITEMSERCSSEVLTSQPGGGRPEDVLAESAGRTSVLLDHGVRMRTLYQYAAQYDLPTIAFVENVTARGAEVRTIAGSLTRLIVFDSAAALIELRGAPQGAVLVHEPSVVDFMVSAFERSWLNAAPFPTQYDRGRVHAVGEDVKSEIMRLLVRGEEDKVISRTIGISPRTCQRHISEIMQRIGARNRAHVGFLISERGLLSDSGGQ